MARLAASPGLRTNFVEFRTLPLLSEPIETHGRIALAPPDAFARITESPMRSSLVLQKGRLRFETDAEITDLSGDPALRRVAEELLHLLGGDLRALRQSHSLAFDLQPQLGPEAWSLELVPRHPQARRFVLRLVLRGVGDLPVSLELEEPEGGRAVMRFSGLEADRALSAEERVLFFGDAQ